jgi:osmoprotectant transport system ATP-binding protein
VSRFVGVDRGLKRLSLLRVADVHLQPGVVTHVGESSQTARHRSDEAETAWVLLLDEREAPVGWIRASELDSRQNLTAEDVDASSPLVHHDTTLRDALSMLLTTLVQTAVVVDDRGRYEGILTLDELGLAFRSDTPQESATVR